MVETRAASRKRKNHQEDQRDQPGKRISRLRGSRKGESYFDNLPQDAVENIIRFTSDRPYSANWKGSVSAEVALTLLKSKTALSACCRSLFSSLETQVRRAKRHTSLVVSGSDDRSRIQFIRLVSTLCEVLNEIDISRETFSATWKRCLISKCPRLNRLSLSTHNENIKFGLSDILSVHRRTLKFLRIFKPRLTEEDVAAISEFGSGLQRLDLKFEVLATGMGPIWESTGAHLEELLVTQSLGQTDVDLPSITRNCTGLRELHFSQFSGYINFGDALEALCAMLGDHLQWLSLEYCDVKAPCLGRIVAACKNVQVKLREVFGCSIQVLQSLGARAHHVDVGQRTAVYEGAVPEGLHLAFERCVNLVSIRIWPLFPEGFLQTILAHPKPLLVDVDAPLLSVEKFGFLLQAFTTNISNLRTLNVSGLMPSRSVLEAFVQANPLLRTVELGDSRQLCGRAEGIEANGEQVDLGAVAKIFLQCEKLEELVLSCFSQQCRAGRMEHYASDCLHARHRDVIVWICGQQYI